MIGCAEHASACMRHSGQETTICIPWREFVPVKRARVDREAPKLDPARVRQLGLVLSRFEFNGLANPNYRAGAFSLKVHAFLAPLRATSVPSTTADGTTRPLPAVVPCVLGLLRGSCIPCACTRTERRVS